jgi:hypothetical protein
MKGGTDLILMICCQLQLSNSKISRLFLVLMPPSRVILQYFLLVDTKYVIPLSNMRPFICFYEFTEDGYNSDNTPA